MNRAPPTCPALRSTFVVFASHPPGLVLHVQFWPDYLAYLRGLLAHARRVVVLTCPTPPGWRTSPLLAARNADLLSLMANSSAVAAGEGLQVLDAAAMMANVPANETKSDGDPHFQCVFFTTNHGASGTLAS